MGYWLGLPRMSGEGQEQSGYSKEKQAKLIEEFCVANNIKLLAHFLEVKSGAELKKRDVFKAAMAFAFDPANNIEGVIFCKFDRATRDSFQGEAVRRLFESRGVRLISIKEKHLTPIILDPNEHAYTKKRREIEMRKSFLAAEEDRLTILERCNEGRQEKIAQGGWGGHRPPYEYDIVQGEMVLNEERWRTVRLIARLREVKDRTGKRMFTYQDICNYLDGRNNLFVDPSNPELGRGRKFITPGQKLSIKRRKGGRLYTCESWNIPTVKRILDEYNNGSRKRWRRFSEIAS